MLKTLRGLVRLVILLGSLVQAMASLWLLILRNRGHISTRQRAEAVQRSCRMLLRRLSIELDLHGQPPRDGLIVANHLSFLDILVFGAATPCIFISKIEVLRWPLFGRAGALAGTVFVDRSRSAIGSDATARVEELLREGVCVVLFPEGTSTDGSHVLAFYSSFFEPAVLSHSRITAAAVGYPRGEGYIESDICYYGDITFFPRLLETLKLRRVVSRLDFAQRGVIYENRKEAARHTRAEVIALRDRQIAASTGVAEAMPQPAHPVVAG
ncbi:MAG TPA: lysophospholipid acyltransferase family protein [Acidisarcina sp.]|nr:lysophospholipid acyltransferase family protein [Acidisarcina sp.]